MGMGTNHHHDYSETFDYQGYQPEESDFSNIQVRPCGCGNSSFRLSGSKYMALVDFAIVCAHFCY
jgi:hypothetical protein